MLLGMDPRDERNRAAIIEGELLARGLAAVVDPGSSADTAAWAACDLAAMVEGCFGTTLEPWSLGTSEGMRWLDRLAESYEAPDPALDRGFLRYLWLLDEGERAGTLALPHSAVGHLDLPLWSLYVHPSRRGRGVAGRALRAAHVAAREVGMRGAVLETHWVWQRSVRFYLAQGMWVVGWKRALAFSWLDELPPYTIEGGDRQLTLLIELDGARVPWLEATRDGTRLVIEPRLEPDAASALARAAPYAHAPLALALAIRGWPLVRSDAHLERRYESADLGQVEGLAMKIQVFEALSRYWGWDVSTPRIPGLAYPPLGELE